MSQYKYQNCNKVNCRIIRFEGLRMLLRYVVAVIRRAPHFSFPPENMEVMPGGSANLTCVAVGSPMPYVRWRQGSVELTPPESIGRSVLALTDIQESATYTCVAANEMGRIENTTNVTVKGNELCCCLSDCLFLILCFLILRIFLLFGHFYLQCFDTVGWASARASSF